MGVESRKGPPLPAPTESDSNTGRDTELDTGSRLTEKSTYSLPSDGSPITIATKKRDKSLGSSGNNKSQTSLLIEYFEGGKDGKSESRRPSVRVKVTPSSKSRSKSAMNDHIQITERKGARKPSYTKRIQLTPDTKGDKHVDDGDDVSVHSYRSATEESNVTSRGGGPIEVEIMPRRHGSPLIPTESSSRYIQQNASDISSMPADSFLDGKTRSPQRKRSRSLSRGEILAAGAASGLAASALADKLSTPSRRRSRSLSRERIVAQKAVEKVRGEKSERRRKHRSRSRSVSGEHLTEGIKSPRRRSSRSHHEESSLSVGDSSLLNSKVSGRSDQYSIRSGTSKSSINNPKLLETVEDAIRRLILPELTALKRDASKRDQREQQRGSSTDLSTSKPKVTLNDGEVLSGNSLKGRKEKNKTIDRVKLEDSPRAFERETSEETVTQDTEGRSRRKRSSDKHRGLEAAVLGAGVGALTAAALQKHHSQDSLEEKKERRRRRTKSRSRSDVSYEERAEELVPPMPLISEINSSELTRSSILSADTERPHSATYEHQVTPVREVSRGVISPVSPSPTRTPVALQQALGTHYSNYSRGNLHDNPPEHQSQTQEYELDEHGRKVPIYEEEYEDSVIEEETKGSGSHAPAGALTGAAAGAGVAALHHHQEDDHDDDADYIAEQNRYDYYHQEVPPPLKYVPYGIDRRGLSPIQSVSGYTEGDPDPQQRNSRLTRSTGSYSSVGKSPQYRDSRSLRSVDSQGNVQGNRHDFAEVRQGGLTDSELTQDGEYWEEQHRLNGQKHDMDAESYRSSGVDYKHMTNYTDESADSPGLNRVATGQAVRGIGANPDYVHTPVGVESAVASLVNASELTGNSGQFDRRASYASFEDGSEQHFTSRGNSPSKRDTFGAGQRSPSKWAEEYDVDEEGRKIAVPRNKNVHTMEKAALAGIAAGAAAHVLKGRSKTSSADQINYEPVREDTGAPLNKSFKERAKEAQVPMPLSPRESVISEAASQAKMGISGIPDMHDPMPEIGYGDGDSDATASPSRKPRSIATSRSPSHEANLKAAEAALVGAAIGAGASAAISGHNRSVSHDNDEEWRRTSEDRKRDTLITNPYEDRSPNGAIATHKLLGQPGFKDVNHQFSGTKLNYHTSSPNALNKDEGYISSAPNARSPGAFTPEQRHKDVNFQNQDMGAAIDGADPFYTPHHSRRVSGMSQGMESPFYDSATGNGIDRIQSKDIIALMDHLTVRDAQRSARDTEILVTLVRAAAEMRNSFEDMKNILLDTEETIITEVQHNTDRSVQKAINGPRPQPPSARSLRQTSQDEMYEDLPTKRQNVFRRALKGLTMKSNNDLGKIEDMLIQLLGDVEGLKVAQGSKSSNNLDNPYDDIRQEGSYEIDHGYEPEGNAGTSTASHASQSGHLSIPLRGSSGARGGPDARKFSDHRISTVPEGDEEDLDHQEEAVLSNQFENSEHLLTPTRENVRGGSVPVGTPPPKVVPASLSNENTPRTGTDKSKKHKSSSSSGWIPKVSRWSETTASTVFRGFRSSGRSSGRKADDQYNDPPSRSGSDLANY
ncbi:hypothetical protein B0O99DRAFT_480813, partial [Bisporella sp. PMI_857]